jgi:hypothetical protein
MSWCNLYVLLLNKCHGAIYMLYDPHASLIYRKKIHNVLRDKISIV